MDKKTIIIILAAIVVLGGVYYGVNRWREQRLANQILEEMYGVNTGVLGGLTGDGGTFQEQVAIEIAKQAAREGAQQKTDEAKEAAKTPEDRYNETEEMATYDANSKAVADEARDIVEEVFGKAKLTSISAGTYGSDVAGFGAAEFKIARLTTGADLGALNKVLTDKGLPIIQSGIENKSAGVMASNDDVAYTFSFEIGEQTVDVTVMTAN